MGVGSGEKRNKLDRFKCGSITSITGVSFLEELNPGQAAYTQRKHCITIDRVVPVKQKQTRNTLERANGALRSE